MKKVLTTVAAIAAGFAAGILAAPKSGKETREDIKKKAGELKTESQSKLKQLPKIALIQLKLVLKRLATRQ